MREPARCIGRRNFFDAMFQGQYKNKIVLHLPSACPVKLLLQTLTERLYLSTPPRPLNSS